MPTMCHPISRRKFLELGATAVATAALSPLVRAQSSKPDSLTVAFLSDTHLGKDGNDKAADQLKQAVHEINASAAALTIMCGDLVHGGQDPKAEKHYPQWVEIASKFKNPWHAVPGNHDPDPIFLKHIQKQTDFTVTRDPFTFICFRDAIGNPDHQGIVTREQIDWIQKQLDDAARARRRAILVSHIIYHHNEKPDVGWMIQKGRAEFARMLAANAKTIAAFFAGHFHEGLRIWSDTHGIHEIVLPSNCWNTARKELDKAPGYSAMEFRPGYTLAGLSADSVTLRYKPLGQPVSATRRLALS
jgi:predicted phosphodiesterase